MTEHFARTVRGSGPGLLLAHGAGGSVAANFGPLLDDLAAGRTVVGVDYPGSGATPRATAPLTLDHLADELVDAARAEGLERFAVLGYSLGAAVAVRAATRHPGRVTALVLTAGFSRPDTRMALLLDVWAGLLDGDPALLVRFLAAVGIGERFLAGLDPVELARLLDDLPALVPAGSAEQVALGARVDVTDDLARVTVPTLVVATTLDLLTGPPLTAALAAGIPGSRLTEVESGHSIGVEAPVEWLSAVRGFLAEVG